MAKHQMEVGAWNKLPHYAVVGDPQRFYVWVNESGHGRSSKWICGKQAFDLYSELRAIKDKKKLADKIREIFSLVGKITYPD